MLLGGPGASELALPGLLVAPWDVFFAIPKICQKIDPPNTYLLGAIFANLTKIAKKTFKMRSFWVPPGVIFWCFSRALVFHRILVIFRCKNYKHKKSRSVSRYVNYDVSWGSPGWKERENLWKLAMKNTSIFHEKSTPYRVKKTDQNKNTIKIDEKMLPGHFVNPQVDFWSIFGSRRGPQNW